MQKLQSEVADTRAIVFDLESRLNAYVLLLFFFSPLHIRFNIPNPIMLIIGVSHFDDHRAEHSNKHIVEELKTLLAE